MTERMSDNPARRDAEAERAQLNVGFIAAARTAVPVLLDLVDRLEADNQQLRDSEAPHCPTCSCGCTCGYGGFHEPENPRCRLNGGV